MTVSNEILNLHLKLRQLVPKLKACNFLKCFTEMETFVRAFVTIYSLCKLLIVKYYHNCDECEVHSFKEGNSSMNHHCLTVL